MPELPEVETISRKLKPDLTGKTILSADLRWPRTLAFPWPRKFKAQIQGQKILDVGRRAKFLIVHLSDFDLLVHLRMSGDLFLRDSTIRPETHDRLVIKLSGDRSLVFNDTRKFGRVWLTADSEEVLGRLGPEPLEAGFTPEWLHAALHHKHRQLKPLLLDQTFLAGLGNIYADEALPRLNANPKVDEAHHRVPPAGFKYLVTEQLCEAAGGPQRYTGRTMRDSHSHLAISEGEWQVFMDLLKETLDRFHVPLAEQSEIVAIIQSTKGDIVVPTE